jgi:hypothetical protein
VEELLRIANSTGVWIAAAPIVFIALLQVYLYHKQIFHAAEAVNVTRDQLRTAFNTGAVTAIGPVIAIFIIMVGLMSVIGAPMAWMRLAVVGAAPTELIAATLGADASRVRFGGEGYDLEVMAVSWWTMAINGVGWLLLVGLFAHKLEDLREKAGRGDVKWLGILSTAAMIGVFGYLNGHSLVARGGPLVAAVTGGVAMVVLLRVAKRCPAIKEYTLGVAMLIGMFVAVFAA